jgi:hypothetical protein
MIQLQIYKKNKIEYAYINKMVKIRCKIMFDQFYSYFV